MTLAKKTRSIGLSGILVGDVPDGGGMPAPADLKQLARTLRGTANFTTEQDQTQDFYCEEYPDAPEESVASEKGLKNLTFNIMEWDNDVLIAVFGGTTKTATVADLDGFTYEVEKFVPPRDQVEIEKSIRALTPYKVGIDIPRAKILARFIWNMARTEIAQVEVVARAMSPEGATDGVYEIYSYKGINGTAPGGG
jgi:hypothetical protein